MEESKMDVDVVCCWVRLDETYYESLVAHTPHATNTQAFAKSRYRDNGELIHSIRALNVFMPWVRKIHIVTNGQLPPDEILSQEKVELHFHHAIFADHYDLPTFNYHAIEANLFRIPGLADYFINTADDFFVGRPIEPADFFGPTGHPRIWREPHAIPDQASATNLWEKNLACSNDAVSKIFGPQVRYPFTHTPVMFSRRIAEEVNDLWRSEIKATSSQKFRHEQDVIFRILYMYYTIHKEMGIEILNERVLQANGVCSLTKEQYKVALIGDRVQDWASVLDSIIDAPPEFFCINDHIGDDDMYAAEVQRILFRFYERLQQQYAPLQRG